MNPNSSNLNAGEHIRALVYILKKFIRRLLRPAILVNVILVFVVALTIISNMAQAGAQVNPGHPWTDIGDGTIVFTGTTNFHTYTLPDATSTILTTNSAVTVGQGGTGLTSASTSAFYLTNSSGVPYTGTTTPAYTLGGTITGNSQSLTGLASLGATGAIFTNGTTTNATSTSLYSTTLNLGNALTVANGGTGLGTLTANSVILGNGTSNPTFVTAGGAGQSLVSNGTTWVAASSTDTINKRNMQVLKNQGATTVTTVGFLAAPTLTATSTTADDSTGIWLNHATSAVSGAASGVISAAFTITELSWEPEYITTIRTDPTSIASVRYWIGMFSADPSASAAPNSLLAAFRYDTSVDGTAFWRAVTINGTGASATVTTTTYPIAVNTSYLMRITCVNAVTPSCTFYINGVLVAANTGTLPASTTLLGYGNRVTTLTTAVRNIKWGRITLNED